MSDLNTVMNYIRGCSDQTVLRNIRDVIYERLDRIAAMNIMQFYPGSKVEANLGKRRGWITGTVTKVNTKTIIVDCGIHRKWKMYGSGVRPRNAALIKHDNGLSVDLALRTPEIQKSENS